MRVKNSWFNILILEILLSHPHVNKNGKRLHVLLWRGFEMPTPLFPMEMESGVAWYQVPKNLYRIV
jgi:hypothetical protein